MFEVQRHMTLSNHGYIGYVVVAAKPFWDGLTPEIRAGLERALSEATSYTNELAERENAEAITAIRDAGKTIVIQLTADEQEAWRMAMLPVYDEMAPRVGKTLITAIQEAVRTAS
jgi:C4-dicarboxylate-binding protein DctP